MKDKHILKLLSTIFIMVIVMACNVFADYNHTWQVVWQKNSSYSVGSILNSPSSVYLSTSSSPNKEVHIQSQFEVESGDDIWLYFETGLYGDNNKYDEAASICSAWVVAENGQVLINLNNTLGGSNSLKYSSGSAVITEETAGKLTLCFTVEGTGCRDVGSCIEAINFELNDSEI